MKKTKSYNYTFFDAKTLQLAKALFDKTSKLEVEYSFTYYRISLHSESWLHDNFEEFLADYRKPYHSVSLTFEFNKYRLNVAVDSYLNYTIIEVSAPDRREIETIFSVFEDNASKFYVPPKVKESEEVIEPEIEQPVVFVGHGQNAQWKDLKDHLHEKHGFKIVAYETGARAGHTIRDILESMLEESSFAILVLTGEDETKDGDVRARQNVIHEAGLFQGSLGFDRAIVLLEEGTEEFSNLAGIQQIRYSKGKIIETYGEVLATLRREFIE